MLAATLDQSSKLSQRVTSMTLTLSMCFLYDFPKN